MSASGPALGPAPRARLGALALNLRLLRPSFRYVDYPEAERLCQVLARRLGERYPAAELRRFAWAPIPRGGSIVLGMLSYALGLERAALLEAPSGDRPLILVDDCALTGARLFAALGERPASRVVFAHLFSVPALRRAIEEREERVEACLAAADLEDHLPALLPDPAERRDWRRRWRRRLGPGRYWLGQPDLLCFAWSEPDRPFWNAETGRLESGWHFASPRLCLAARAELGAPPREPAGPSWRVPPEVVWGDFDDELWLCRSDSGEVHALRGVARDLWRAVAAWGDPATASEWLARRYEVGAEELAGDLGRTLEALVERELLEPPEAGHAGV